ncbi:hypothetical protein GUJ93_ZPchr0009g983 [Zizania palustris]|uniref:Uncharacterized protein n=1 Tax=Zizania palustris TaxID=103762 RepID=A0A8J5UZ84_ZIZPA|nr:hypothetical protein GUJ93_ZPchr0009g983 [Zizania palustris]
MVFRRAGYSLPRTTVALALWLGGIQFNAIPILASLYLSPLPRRNQRTRKQSVVVVDLEVDSSWEVDELMLDYCNPSGLSVGSKPCKAYEDAFVKRAKERFPSEYYLLTACLNNEIANAKLCSLQSIGASNVSLKH